MDDVLVSAAQLVLVIQWSRAKRYLSKLLAMLLEKLISDGIGHCIATEIIFNKLSSAFQAHYIIFRPV